MAAYNEEEALIPCVDDVLDFLREHVVDGELILVDDGSTDRTAAMVDDLAKKHARVISKHLPRNQGMGAALRLGYAATSKEWVTMLPADGQIKAKEILRLYVASNEADVVTTLYDNRPVDLFRRVISLGLRALTVLIVGTRAKTEGNYLIRKSLLDALPLCSDSFLLNLEIPIRAKRAGYRVRTTLISVSPRIAGVSKAVTPHRVSQTFFELFWLRLRMIKERFGSGLRDRS